MKRLVLFALAAASAVLFAACASTEPEKKKEPELPKEDPVIAKAKAEWREFVQKKEREERDRHDLNTLQNDKMKVFPWRDTGERRSENLHERKNKSIFSLW